MKLPREILDRVDRVYDYHVRSKHTYESVRIPGFELDWKNQPSPYRVFPDFPRVSLPTHLIGTDIPALSLLMRGREALPESQLNPPQNLQTLAAWLYLSNGLTIRKHRGDVQWWLRSCPSSGALYPYEIYVVGREIDGLEPGLYHYSPEDYSLHKLRDLAESMTCMLSAPQEMGVLARAPCALLISTIYWRSAWKYRTRGYRYALQDAGHLIENVRTVGTGLGIPIRLRMSVHDASMSELIGIPENAPFGDMESVQAVVLWTAKSGTKVTPSATVPVSHESPVGGSADRARLASIARPALSSVVVDYPEIVRAHFDCVTPDATTAELRPPLTELSPLPPGAAGQELSVTDEEPIGKPLDRVLLNRRSARDFERRAIPRDAFLSINLAAFCSGTSAPVFPSGDHVGIVRPFWIIQDVIGMDSGVWYFHPPSRHWTRLSRGEYRLEAAYLSLEQALCGNASAVCFMMANLHQLMTRAGPDTYRLAHLEAGSAGQRMYLASEAMSLGCSGIGAFYDDEVKKFLGLENTGWETIYEVAIGVPITDSEMVGAEGHTQIDQETADGRKKEGPASDPDLDGSWRD
jgi:SagB-type dehydrogenase family enzyme